VLNRYAAKYALNSPKGVQRLLGDYHHLYARRIDKSDFPASDILMDLRLAIAKAGLTDRQRQALRLYYIELKTQEEVAMEMDGITQAGVHYHLQGALKRLATVYRRWDYGGVTVGSSDVVNERDEGEGGIPVC
jgi:DNA-directed RNA polymerase specialized sigma24 family protein